MRKIVQDNLRPGVSGMMRVKNDGQFIEACVESCISALDELIIVWNDCTDNSAEEIERMRLRYPDKIKTFEYKYKVYSTNLTKEEYEYAKSLPEDSPHLLCNYYNFCLSKVTCQYAVKIDADQIYFTEVFRELTRIVKNRNKVINNIKMLPGALFFFYYRILWHIQKYMSLPLHRILFSPFKSVIKSYNRLAYSKIDSGTDLSLSGYNIFILNERQHIFTGAKYKGYHILPPFNGIGDHLLFKLTDDCRYEVNDMQSYSMSRNENYSLIEIFRHEATTMPVGFFWNHISSMRSSVFDRIVSIYDNDKSILLDTEETDNYKYEDLISMSESESSLFSYQDKLYYKFQFILSEGTRLNNLPDLKGTQN